jgi:type II secretory pathway pseudopilin PulG
MGTSTQNSTAEHPAISPARRIDQGSTLVEIIISITLMSIVVAAVLGAVQTSIRSSSVAFRAAEVETVLLNAGDKINRAPQLCNYDAYVDAAMPTDSGWNATQISVTVQKLVAHTGAASDWATQTCPDPIEPFDVQRLTISVTDVRGEITRTLTVVKSDVN